MVCRWFKLFENGLNSHASKEDIRLYFGRWFCREYHYYIVHWSVSYLDCVIDLTSVTPGRTDSTNIPSISCMRGLTCRRWMDLDSLLAVKPFGIICVMRNKDVLYIPHSLLKKLCKQYLSNILSALHSPRSLLKECHSVTSM